MNAKTKRTPAEVANGQLQMVVDLDERGSFKAHVETEDGKEIFAFSNEDENGWPEPLWLVENGFMDHARDCDGLLEYLQSLGVVAAGSSLTVSG